MTAETDPPKCAKCGSDTKRSDTRGLVSAHCAVCRLRWATRADFELFLRSRKLGWLVRFEPKLEMRPLPCPACDGVDLRPASFGSLIALRWCPDCEGILLSDESFVAILDSPSYDVIADLRDIFRRGWAWIRRGA